MQTNEAILKALENGYEPKELSLPEGWTAQILLDPEFWRALGKGLGWDKYEPGEPFYIPDRHRNSPRWKKQWHFLIDHLAEGKDINSFFEEICKNK